MGFHVDISFFLSAVNLISGLYGKYIYIIFKENNRESLVVLWLRLWLPIQGAQVRSLVCQDSSSHSY